MSENMENRILGSLKWRYATKRFDSTKKIPESTWKVLIETMRLAPSSYGLQPWRFIHVNSQPIRERLRPATWNQSQVTDCSHYIVFTALKKMDEAYIDRFIQLNSTTRNVSVESLSSYRNMMVKNLVTELVKNSIPAWAERQSYLAMGFLLESAALLGIDACPIEGLEPKRYDELLGIQSTDYATVAAVALGYRHAEDKYQHNPKVRFKTEEVLTVV